LGQAGSVKLPNFLMPPLMNNHGNYIVSLGNVCRWLAQPRPRRWALRFIRGSPQPACFTMRPAQ
jgi:hypothetical protein